MGAGKEVQDETGRSSYMAIRPNIKGVSIFAILGVLAVTVLLSVQGRAQVAGATVTGTVTDPSGAVLPNSQISITNTATGITTSATTDSAGFYTVPNLIPGPYQVTIRAEGFRTEIRSGITLTVGEQQVLNAALHLGQTSQTIQVTGGQPNVDLASSAISGHVDQKEVVEMPLNGRDWTLLAALQPGVSNLSSQQDAISSGFNRGNRGYGAQMSINGGRPEQNNYRINGISANDYVNGGPGNILGSSLGVDAIAEFSIISTNYSAEYGRTSGGVINAITRSGTNSFHGNVYEFIRNSALDAATWVANANGVPKPPFRQNQFGASAGGPIQKDRTFFFADYEGIRQSLGLATVDNVPSQDARNGLLSFASPASFPTGCVATAVTNQCRVTVSPLVTPFLPLWPLPNDGLIAPGNTGYFAFAPQQVATENFVTGRVDRRFSDRDSMFGSYEYDKGTMVAPDSLNNILTGNALTRQLAAIEETHVFNPQLVNNFRFGYNRTVAFNATVLGVINPLAKDKSLGSVPGGDNPQMTISGITEVIGGENSVSDTLFWYNSIQFYDDAFFTKGRHGLKFGVGIERIQTDEVDASDPGGAFTYGSLASFLTNQGSGAAFSSVLPGPTNPFGFRQAIAGVYLQDDIRWRPYLTFNLGMRYEMSSVPTGADGKIGAIPTPTSPLPICGVVYPGCAGTGPLFHNPTYGNVEPRVGFAWDPFHNGKTSVRGGFGIYDMLPLAWQFLSGLGANAPFNPGGSASNFPNGSFPTGAFAFVTASPRLRTPYVENNPKRNYVMQWNLNVQRDLLPNLTAMMAYVGSRGVHMMYRSGDVNDVLPTLTPQGYEWPCPGGFNASGLCKDPGTGIWRNPVLGQMSSTQWNESSFYDALELQVTKRMKHGFQLQGSYTWGKSLDQGSAGYAGDSFLNGKKASFTWLDPRLEYGPSDFNISQLLTINGTWQLLAPRSLPGAAMSLLGGWQLGGIYTVDTGSPFSLVLGGDPVGTRGIIYWEPPNRLAGPGCKTPINPGNFTTYIKTQCFAFPNPSTLLGNSGRNSLTGPGLMNLDFSLFKNNYIKRISESFNAQFRVEVFNSLNRPNLASPTDNNEPFNASGDPVGSFAKLDLLATPAREIQFALKLIW
jgi:hypothetical protein